MVSQGIRAWVARAGVGLVASLPVAVAAQSANLQVYGTLLPYFEVISIRGATAPAPADGATQVPKSAYTGAQLATMARMTPGTSNFGIRGSEEIGGGTRALFQIESAVFVDGDQFPVALAARNTGVGLAGSWGTVMLGSWDTPYKVVTLDLGPLRGLNPFDNMITGNPGFNLPVTVTQGGRVTGRADASFNRRQGNSIQYWSPAWAGFSARVAYSMPEGRTDATVSTPGTRPDLWSLVARYDLDAWSLRYSYERHNDYFGLAQLGGSPGATLTNTSSRDTGHQLAFVYAAGGTRITFIYDRLDYRTDDSAQAAVTHYRRDGGYLTLSQQFGPHKLWGAIGRADGGACVANGIHCGTDGLGAMQWSLGYVLSLSKRTDLYATVFSIANDRSATYAAFPPPVAVAPGGTTRSAGMGILHAF
jgi:predicted porin